MKEKIEMIACTPSEIGEVFKDKTAADLTEEELEKIRKGYEI